MGYNRAIRAVGLGLLAALVLSAVATDNALALPEIGRCVVQARHEGRYTDANCFTKATRVSEKYTGEYERAPGPGSGGVAFTLRLTGEVFLHGKKFLSLVCSQVVARGKYDVDGSSPPTIKGVEGVVEDFTGCQFSAPIDVECHSEGAREYEIVSSELEGNLGYIKKAALKQVGLELHPHVKGGPLLEFECTAVRERIVVKECNAGEAVCGPEEKGGNCIISTAAPINTMATTATLTYKATDSYSGVQEPKHFENLKPPICNLEDTFTGETRENEREAWLTGYLPVEMISEQPLEIFA